MMVLWQPGKWLNLNNNLWLFFMRRLFLLSGRAFSVFTRMASKKVALNLNIEQKSTDITCLIPARLHPSIRQVNPTFGLAT